MSRRLRAVDRTQLSQRRLLLVVFLSAFFLFGVSGFVPSAQAVSRASVTTAIFAFGTTSPDLTGATLTPGTSDVVDQATVTGSASFTDGDVTYSLFLGGTCTGTAFAISGVTIVAGSVPPSLDTGLLTGTTPPLTPGSYSWDAFYDGGSNYASSTSACEPFTVAQGTSIPQFPFGFALLFAVMIPIMLLLRNMRIRKLAVSI